MKQPHGIKPPKIRHYNTWIKEGDNYFRYKYYQNSLARLQAAGFHVYSDTGEILYTKKDCINQIELQHIKTCEFVFLFAGNYAHGYTIFTKNLNTIKPKNKNGKKINP